MEDKDIFSVRWKTIPCFSDDECWCAPVVTEDYNDKLEEEIISVGAVKREISEYIVKLHNDSLERINNKNREIGI